MPLVRKPQGTPAQPPTAPDVSSGDDVLEALEAANADDRWTAARAAAAVPASAPRLGAALLKEPDARVRETLFSSLTRIGTTESTQILLSLLRSNDAALRTGALDSLKIRAHSDAAFLPRLLEDTDVDVRILSCELARDLGGDDASRLLRDLLARERDANVSAAAIEVLAEVGGPDAVPVLEECKRRFNASPFLVFAATTAVDRLKAQTPSPRA